MSNLSDRELTVLQLVAKRASIREMAADLDVGVGTIQSILGKLEGDGYITVPETRLARMRELTQKGTDVLKRERLLQ